MAYDKKNLFSVPYIGGTVCIAYNPAYVDESEVNSWDVLWNEKYAGNIFMMDSERDSIAVALMKLGYSINTKNMDELNAAKDLLIEQKPLVLSYTSDDVKEKMAKVVEHYDQLIDFEVILTVIKNPSVSDSHIAEAKCNIAGARIHIEEKAETMYASIDLLADKLNRQIQKYKDKTIKGKHKADSIRTAAAEEVEDTEEEVVAE